jgi:serine/threonine protein kinase
VTYSSFRYYLDPYMASSYHYRAPEALMQNQHYDKKIDIWALGVIFYYIMTNKYIFTELNDTDALNDIFKIFGTPTDWDLYNKYEYKEIINNYPRNFKLIDEIFSTYTQLIVPCFVYDPVKRPDTTELLVIVDKYY